MPRGGVTVMVMVAFGSQPLFRANLAKFGPNSYIFHKVGPGRVPHGSGAAACGAWWCASKVGRGAGGHGRQISAIRPPRRSPDTELMVFPVDFR